MPGERERGGREEGGKEIAWMTAVSVVVKYVHTFWDGVAWMACSAPPPSYFIEPPVFMIMLEVGPKMPAF